MLMNIMRWIVIIVNLVLIFTSVYALKNENENGDISNAGLFIFMYILLLNTYLLLRGGF